MTRTPRRKIAGEALGEIAAAAYDVPLNSQASLSGGDESMCSLKEWLDH